LGEGNNNQMIQTPPQGGGGDCDLSAKRTARGGGETGIRTHKGVKGEKWERRSIETKKTKNLLEAAKQAKS